MPSSRRRVAASLLAVAAAQYAPGPPAWSQQGYDAARGWLAPASTVRSGPTGVAWAAVLAGSQPVSTPAVGPGGYVAVSLSGMLYLLAPNATVWGTSLPNSRGLGVGGPAFTPDGALLVVVTGMSMISG